MKIGWIFPGQGAQYRGMGKDFFDSFPIAKQTFQEADDLLKEHLSDLIFEGPEEALTQTKNSQVAIFVVSMAIARVVRKELPHLEPAACSGLSLGEYTALSASGRLPFGQTLLLVNERARLMNEACERFPGGMSAVLGMGGREVEEALERIPGIWVANFNAPGQIVISGTKEGLGKAALVLKEKGAKRIVPLAVHGAFHSGLMESAQQGLSPSIEGLVFQDSPIDWVMNVPGDFVETEEEIRRYLKAQVTHPVRWEQGINAMKENGIEWFLEIGCGKTLTGLNKKMGIPSISSIEKVADLEFSHGTS